MHPPKHKIYKTIRSLTKLYTILQNLQHYIYKTIQNTEVCETSKTLHNHIQHQKRYTTIDNYTILYTTSQTSENKIQNKAHNSTHVCKTFQTQAIQTITKIYKQLNGVAHNSPTLYNTLQLFSHIYQILQNMYKHSFTKLWAKTIRNFK